MSIPLTGAGLAVDFLPFTPASISGLQLWLDASDASTLFTDSAGTIPATADGDPVGCWKDKSGNSYHATQVDGTAKPVQRHSVLNSKSIVRLDGLSKRLTVPSSTSIFNFLHATQGSVFFVFRTNPSIANPDNIYPLAENSGLGATNGYSIWYDDRSGSGYNDTIQCIGGQGYNNFYIVCPNNTLPTGSWKILFNQTKGQDSNAKERSKIYVNNSLISADNTQSGSYVGNAGRNLTIGGAPNAFWLNGDIAEIIIYSLALSDSDKTSVSDYLNAKWSIY